MICWLNKERYGKFFSIFYYLGKLAVRVAGIKGGMALKWWKRLIFSIISVIWGYASLDYLFYAFQLLANTKNAEKVYRPEKDGLMQLLGAGLFLLWFVIITFYFYLIRRTSNQIDLVEANRKTGKEKVKRRWFDIMFQAALLLTGLLLRWCYLIFIYFPKI